MNIQLAQAIIAGLLGGGFIGFIEFLIRRKDEKCDKNKEVLAAVEKLEKKMDERFNILDAKITEVDEKGDERNAVESRIRILHFRDEMLEGKSHTHDSFQQVLTDIDDYELYCSSHPTFRNNQTISTIQHIKRNYDERLERNDFL